MAKRGWMHTDIMNKSKYRIFIISFLAFIGCWAVSMGDTTLTRPFFAPFLPTFSYLIDIFFLIVLRKKVASNKDFMLIAVPVTCFLLYITNVYDRNHYAPNALFFLNLVVFALTEDSEKLSAFVIIKKVFVVSAIFGIIAFFSYNLGLGIPYSEVPYYDENPNSFYIDYRVAYLVERLGICRLCGFVNEPGLYGTLIAFLLIADSYNLKKKENIILLMAAILTFSSAFFILTLIYLILWYIRSVKVLIIIAIVVGFVLYYLLYIESDNELLKALTIGKFENGLSAVRSNDGIESALVKLQNKGGLLWGYGNGFFSSHFTEGSSYKNVILDFGVVGFMILYIPLLWVSVLWAKHSRQAMILVLCFFVSIYQRPNIFNPIYFLFLFGGIQYIKSLKLKS